MGDYGNSSRAFDTLLLTISLNRGDETKALQLSAGQGRINGRAACTRVAGLMRQVMRVQLACSMILGDCMLVDWTGV